MGLFLPLVKADQVNHLVYARAAAEELDKSREIMDYATAVPAFQTWSKGFSDVTMGKSLGNVRAMHNPRHLAGVVKTLNFDDTAKGVDVCIKVLDPVDWDKIEHGGYTGISIGGGYAKKWPDPLDKSVTRYTPRLQEISFVDSPCIPSARIMEMQKQDGTVEEVLLKGVPRTFADLQPPRTFAEMEKGLIGAGVGGVLGHYIGKELGRRMAGGAAHQLGMAGARNGSRISVAEHLGNVAMAERLGGGVGAGVGTVAGVGVTSARAAPPVLPRRRRKNFGQPGMKGHALIHISASKQEILDNLEKANPAGAITYLSRGKLFSSAPIEHGAAFVGQHGKKVVTPAIKDPVSYTSRGKTFIHQGGETVRFTKQEILDNLEKGLIGAGVGGILGHYIGKELGRRMAGGAAHQLGMAAARNGSRISVRAHMANVGTAEVFGRRVGAGVGAATGVATGAALTSTRKSKTPAALKQEILDNLDKASAEEKAKIETTMHEFKHGKLRSYRGLDAKGEPRKGPRVMDRKQAIAIALSQARRMGKMDDSVLVAALTDRLMKQAA